MGTGRSATQIGHLAIRLTLLWFGLMPCGALAAMCTFVPQGEGRVSDIIDGRTLRLQDGREVRLAGIEALPGSDRTLAALLGGRDVTLHGDSDTPDRYGRQPAFVFVTQAPASVQRDLLAQGVALAAATVTDSDCVAELRRAETEARRLNRGIWGNGTVIKNAESAGDILARMGQFTVVEGRVLSVRQAGATTYVNFGRRWTQDFAVTISRRMMAAFEAAGISLKSLERRKIRVRGFVGRRGPRGGPGIEALRVGQIEVVGDN
jgi:endonuclease YncB( thermonuclease family)